jgi:hypothetical protein
MSRSKTILLAALLSIISNTSFAQFVDIDAGDGMTFWLHAKKEAKPAFRYSLLPGFLEQQKGNAAIHYGKVTAEQIAFFGDFALQDRISEVPSLSLEDVLQSPDAAGACPENIYLRLRQAALCNRCDWELPLKEVPFFDILLPEIQQTRQFARLLVAKARLEIAQNKFDAALETMQTGYALARNTGNGPTYIHLLVGIAIKSMMDAQLECFIQQPDAPNVYWAIANLPSPFFSIKKSANVEGSILELSFPAFRGLNAENISNHTDEFWKRKIAKLLAVSQQALAVRRITDAELNDAEKLDELFKTNHRRAQRLLLGMGLSEAKTKSLTAVQAVTLAAVMEFHIDNEAMIKWTSLPYHSCVEQLREAEEKLQDVDERTSVLRLASFIAPSSTQIMSATVRSERQTAVLQLMSSLQIFAEQNEDRLPDSLTELTMAPAPHDPVTGKPFETKTENDVMAIVGPRIPARPLDLRVEMIERD